MADLYTNAAKIIDKILAKQGCPKSLVINNRNVGNKKKLYALVCEALKFKSVTEKIIEDTKLLSTEKQLKHSMALVLLYDFLFGKGLQLGGRLKEIITRNKTRLHASLAMMKVKAKVMKNEDLLPEHVRSQQEHPIPRYARVNTLKMSTEEAINWFTNNGYELESTESKSFTVDEHIPDVLAFPAGTDFHNNQLYCEGKIILQDKASCFPAFVLDPRPGSRVIDACSAPGNKTSHLAAIMQNNGKIFAFDISSKRITTMKKLLQKTGEHVTEVKNEDFLKTNPKDAIYKDVAYILVDPSCSGSGIVTRLDYVDKNHEEMDNKEKQRIESLAKFQKTVLSHALSFPAVQRVVYSTCSVHNEENERVVGEVLEKYKDTFELCNVLPSWPYRGRPVITEDDRMKCVRASPQEGQTSGFFLALFTRKSPMHHHDSAQTNEIARILEKNKTKRKRKSVESSPDLQNGSSKKTKTLTQKNRKRKNRKKEKKKNETKVKQNVL